MVFLCFDLKGQGAVSDLDSMHTWLITQTPSALFGFYPSFQVGVERRFNEKARLELELGLLFFQNYFEKPVSGHRAKLSFKFGPIDRINFLVNLHYRKVVVEDSGWTFMEDGQFETFDEYELFRTRIGSSIGFGECYAFSERFQFEWSTSFGSGFRNRHEIAENGVKRNVRDWDRAPIFDLSLKLLYAID